MSGTGYDAALDGSRGEVSARVGTTVFHNQKSIGIRQVNDGEFESVDFQIPGAFRATVTDGEELHPWLGGHGAIR